MNQRRPGLLSIAPWRIAMWGAIAAILLAPLIAMRLSDRVAWTAFDFAVAVALLVGAGLTYEFASRRTSKLAWRLAIGGVILTAVALIWAQGAVGIL